MRDQTKAYLAGVMDAEGCVTIGKSKDPRGLIYSARITISNKNNDLMKYLVHHFGGYVTKTKPKKASHNICYSWHLSSAKHTLTFLSLITPLLRGKKAQAELLSEYINLNGAYCPPVREKMYLQAQDMKKEVRVTTETPTSSKLDFAYLAGFFDGEGTVSLIQFIGHGHQQYASRVFVTNADKPMLDMFVHYFGGKVREHQKPNKQCYRWELAKNTDREHFILQILPYLIVKKEEADIVLEFLRLRSTEAKSQRKNLYDRLKKVKQERMIQSHLHGDMQCAPMETLVA